MSYYSSTAFQGDQEWPLSKPLPPGIQQFRDFLQEIDLRKFPRCEEYLAVGRSLVEPSSEELEKRKWQGNHIEEKKRKQNLHRHYFYNQSSAVILLQVMSIGLRFMGASLFIWLYLWNLYYFITSLKLSSLIPELNSILLCDGFYLSGITLKKIENRLSHKEGATFNRQTGKVKIYRDGDESLIDFKNFVPLASRKTSYKSNPYYKTCIRNHGELIRLIVIMSNSSLATGIIEYNFLRHYMNITRPLL